MNDGTVCTKPPWLDVTQNYGLFRLFSSVRNSLVRPLTSPTNSLIKRTMRSGREETESGDKIILSTQSQYSNALVLERTNYACYKTIAPVCKSFDSK
jgi:hypothetical protein